MFQGGPASAPAAKRNIGLQARIDRYIHHNYIVGMKPLRFVWDERKNTINQRKHGVSFEEGQAVFADEYALLIHDPDHSNDEDRFLLLGLSAIARMLVVCHCYQEREDVVRIFSAWKATKSETANYVHRRR